MSFDPAFVYILENPQGTYPIVIPSASDTAAGVMSAQDKASLDVAVSEVLSLESTDGQRPVPLADGAETDDVIPQNIALVDADNTAIVACFNITVTAWSDDGVDVLSVQQGVTYKGDGSGVFTLVAASTAVRRETGGAAGWTVTPNVVSSLPNVELVGEAGRVINWMVFVDNWSAP